MTAKAQLAVLVYFFEAIVAHPAGRPLLAEICSLLAVSNTVVYLAASSSSSVAVRLLVLPVFFLKQAVGAAIFAAVYYAILLASGTLGRRPTNAHAWLPTLIATFIFPAVPVVFPLLPKNATDRISAAWQLWPVWSTLLLPIMRSLTSRQSPGSALNTLGWLGALFHLYSIADTVLNWHKQVPIKLFTSSHDGIGATFITADIIVTYISTLIFLLATSSRAVSLPKAIATTVVAGPAAALAWFLADSDSVDLASKQK